MSAETGGKGSAMNSESRAELEATQTKIALAALVVPVFFVVVFAACIIGTYHQPHPHGIRLAVVGPPAQTAPVRAGLERVGGSAFKITPAATPKTFKTTIARWPASAFAFLALTG